MNPELIYRMLAEDPNVYRGMSVEEVTYCTITNHYDQKQAYKMDIIKEEGSEDRITPVAIFLHGGGFTEPCELEASLKQALDAAGITNELITLEGSPHTPLDRFEEYMPRILEWIADEA